MVKLPERLSDLTGKRAVLPTTLVGNSGLASASSGTVLCSHRACNVPIVQVMCAECPPPSLPPGLHHHYYEPEEMRAALQQVSSVPLCCMPNR